MYLQTTILEKNLQNLKESGDMGGFLQRGRRRSKKDNSERNFTCGCGKDYLSYPALYTHIKNKHNGEAPEGTTLEAQNRTRNRPSRLSDNEEPSRMSAVGTFDRLPNEELPDEQAERLIKRFSERLWGARGGGGGR